MTTIRIKPSLTSKEERFIYTDLSLLFSTHNYSINLMEVVRALVREHYDDLPLFLWGIVKNNDGYFKVLVYDEDSIKPFKIKINNEENITINSTKLYNVDNFVFNITEDKWPQALDPYSQNNNDRLKPYFNEFKLQNFEGLPTGPHFVNKNEYNFDQAVSIFTALKPYADLYRYYNEDNKKLEKLKSDYELLKQNVSKINDDLSIENQFESISSKLNEKAEQIQKTLKESCHDFSDKYAEYLNISEKIICIKEYLAWALHCSAIRCYNSKQIHDPKNIEIFNRHFGKLICIEEKGLTDIKKVYEMVNKWSFNELENIINAVVVSNVNTTIGWSVAEKKYFKENINQIAEILKKLIPDLDYLPFSTWDIEKLKLQFTEGFVLHPKIKKLETSKEQILIDVSTIIRTDKSQKYQKLNETNFDNEEEMLGKVSRNISLFKRKIENYNKFLDYQKSAKEIKVRTEEWSKYLTKTTEDILKQIQQDQPTTQKTDIKSIVLPAFLTKLISETQEAIDDVNADSDQILKIKQLSKNISRKKRQLKSCKNKICAIDIDTEFILQQLDALKELFEKIKLLSSFLQQLKTSLETILINYPLIESNDDIKAAGLSDEFYDNYHGYMSKKSSIEKMQEKFLSMNLKSLNKLSIEEIEKEKINLAEELKMIENFYDKLKNLLKKATESLSQKSLEKKPIENNMEEPQCVEPTNQKIPVPIPTTHSVAPKASKPSFFKRHGKEILKGGMWGLGFVALIMAALTNVGLGATIFRGIAAFVSNMSLAISGKALPVSMGGFLGSSAIVSGFGAIGSLLGGLKSMMKEYKDKPTKFPTPESHKDSKTTEGNKPEINNSHGLIQKKLSNPNNPVQTDKSNDQVNNNNNTTTNNSPSTGIEDEIMQKPKDIQQPISPTFR